MHSFIGWMITYVGLLGAVKNARVETLLLKDVVALHAGLDSLKGVEHTPEKTTSAGTTDKTTNEDLLRGCRLTRSVDETEAKLRAEKVETKARNVTEHGGTEALVETGNTVSTAQLSGSIKDTSVLTCKLREQRKTNLLVSHPDYHKRRVYHHMESNNNHDVERISTLLDGSID